jgi:excisionase family DNA binding protein
LNVSIDLITAQELADKLNLSVETIWRYTREKKIPYIELGKKQYRYKIDEVIKSLTGDTVKESKGKYISDDKFYTYEDYLKLSEEPGYKYEILQGILVKEPSPNVIHQRVSRRLQRILEDYFWEIDPSGEIFNAPLDVTILDSVVQPDIFYIPSNQKSIAKETRIDGPPTLVVEIISLSSRRKDRLQKLQIYQGAKVTHYWLVDPHEKTLECYELKDSHYAIIVGGMDNEVIKHPSFEGLEIELEILWK